jgi:hypothetical protein
MKNRIAVGVVAKFQGPHENGWLLDIWPIVTKLMFVLT